MTIQEIKTKFPLTWGALRDLAYDRQLRINERFVFPFQERATIEATERFLATLTGEERETFAYGEAGEAEDIVARSGPDGERAEELFAEIFDGEYAAVMK